ncbi:unnamed protein product [Cunninghamella echinulata]
MSLTDFCVSLPKIEAHAHINGSLSVSTMRELVALKKDMNPELAAFQIPIHLIVLTNDEASVQLATQRVIENSQRMESNISS